MEVLLRNKVKIFISFCSAFLSPSSIQFSLYESEALLDLVITKSILTYIKCIDGFFVNAAKIHCSASINGLNCLDDTGKTV